MSEFEKQLLEAMFALTEAQHRLATSVSDASHRLSQDLMCLGQAQAQAQATRKD